ncbi:hypothetical protein EYC80_008354 [Monilinia laxa]|uniref:FAD-binding domain-containing protein n=1 Tax=Monilinia laxa TaxID=61186 RepID=A0A5N6JSX3_MONLA|nr:hypothetical protein EYC80_008354 [Monilinia laxa]
MGTLTPERKIRIAIIGGGLAGATLLRSLLTHPHLSADIYESASAFSERGAAVGLAINAQNALAEMGIADVVQKAGGVRMHSSRTIVVSWGRGPHAGELIFDLASELQGWVVHRAELLRELLGPVPRESMHTNKKVVGIEERDGGIAVSFQDGTVVEADAVIGADGIHGFVRGHVLGEEHPAVKARFAGFWDCRSLVSMQRAKEVLGEKYFEEQRQYVWCGDRGFFLHDVLDGGETVQCIASVMKSPTSPWETDEKTRKKDLHRTTLEAAFEPWTNSPISEPMIELLLENPDLQAYAQWHHSENAPTYTKRAVCTMGDAAHAMTPWQGSGAGQAIEDSLILSTLLARITRASQLPSAFAAYDAICRPRSQRVVASSVVTGKLMCGGGAERVSG